MTPLPELPDDVLGDILLRLPPEDPACLLRASLACKRWRRVLADPTFRRRRRALHQRPSFLGLLYVVSKDIPYLSRFVPNEPVSGLPASRDLPGWLLLDCRHGRALFATPRPGQHFNKVPHDLIVWDPLTGKQRRLPRPSPPPTTDSPIGLTFNAAVLCAAAAEGCDHSGCRGGPFRVVVLFAPGYDIRWCAMSARVYSSETGKWSRTASVYHPDFFFPVSSGPSVLVGDTLYFLLSNNHILKYQLGTHCLSVITEPRPTLLRFGSICITSTEDGGWGLTGVERVINSSITPARLCRYSREEGPDGVGQWELVSATKLEVPDGTIPDSSFVYGNSSVFKPSAQVLSFVDGTDVFFLGIRKSASDPGSVYMVQLNSGRATKVLEDFTSVFPYTSFCVPVTEVTGKGKLKLLVQRLLKCRILRPCHGKVQMVEQ